MTDYAFPRLQAITLGLIAAALVALTLASSGHPAAAAPQAAAPAAHAPHAGGTAISSTLDGGEEPTADADFFADLFDGQATDLAPQQAADLLATAHRICDLGQPRADWLASLTAPGPHALTDGEATKLYDTSVAAFCPSAWHA